MTAAHRRARMVRIHRPEVADMMQLRVTEKVPWQVHSCASGNVNR